jgi:cytochrome d ubiquinol oxidase subunit II
VGCALGGLFHGGKLESALWKAVWDKAILVSSFLPALLFGVAFGNIFKGLPMDAAGYHGSLLSLLNPYGLLTGVLFVVLFLTHGALYQSVKTTGPLQKRAVVAARALWIPLLLVAVIFLAATYPATRLFDNYLKTPALFLVPGAAVAAGLVGLFPNLIPSTQDPHYSLTITNSSSSPYTLMIMTWVAFIFIPIVIAYKIWAYRVFRAPDTNQQVLEDTNAY